jgi:hypothetical protein
VPGRKPVSCDDAGGLVRDLFAKMVRVIGWCIGGVFLETNGRPNAVFAKFCADRLPSTGRRSPESGNQCRLRSRALDFSWFLPGTGADNEQFAEHMHVATENRQAQIAQIIQSLTSNLVWARIRRGLKHRSHLAVAQTRFGCIDRPQQRIVVCRNGGIHRPQF